MDGKGKTTMLDIAHGATNGSVARLELGNLEPLLQELIKAVRSVSCNVSVPALGPPEVTIQTPDVRIDFLPLVAAIKELRPPDMHVSVPPMPAPQISISTPRQILLASVLAFFVIGDFAVRVWELIHQ